MSPWSERAGPISSCPAIAEERQVIPLGPKLVHLRQEGDVLHPAREPHEGLMRLKAEMGSYAFAAQYQQSPAPRGAGIVKWDWFQTYDVPPEKGSGGPDRPELGHRFPRPRSTTTSLRA